MKRHKHSEVVGALFSVIRDSPSVFYTSGTEYNNILLLQFIVNTKAVMQLNSLTMQFCFLGQNRAHIFADLVNKITPFCGRSV